MWWSCLSKWWICLDGTCDCSTGYSGADCEIHCSSDIIGTWIVTGGQSANCDFGSYEFSKGSTNTEILISTGDVHPWNRLTVFRLKKVIKK